MKNKYIAKATSLFCTLMIAIYSFAQDGELLDIDISINEPEWYEKPLVWVGVAVFLLILVLILRKGKKG